MIDTLKDIYNSEALGPMMPGWDCANNLSIELCRFSTMLEQKLSG